MFGADIAKAIFVPVPVCAHITALRGIFTGSSAAEYRGQRRAFTRGGPIDGEALVAFLLFLVADAGTRGYALLLDAFRDQARSFGLPERAAFGCSDSA